MTLRTSPVRRRARRIGGPLRGGAPGPRRHPRADATNAAHPERFVRKAPTPPELSAVAWIDEPEEEAAGTTNP